MAFDSGSLSFRIFWYKDHLDDSVIKNFAEGIAPEISTLSTSPIEGWAGWRHFLDRDISLESCYFIPWLHLALMRAERVIPKPLLRAYCRMEEEAERKARGLEYLPRKLKAEIKQRVQDALLPEMPPTLSGIYSVTNLSTNIIYADSLKTSSVDAFSKVFRETTGRPLALFTPATAALVRKQINVNDLSASVFTNDESVAPADQCNLGFEFLTWLWFWWEVKSDLFESPIGEKCQVMLEGPITFFNEGRGAHNVVLRNGLPLQSREAGTALQCGKMVSKINFSLAVGDKAWSATIDSEFAIRSLKLPKDTDNGGNASFQERMESIDKFVNTFLHLFDIFLNERKSKSWEKTLDEIRAWVQRRASAEDGRITAE